MMNHSKNPSKDSIVITLVIFILLNLSLINNSIAQCDPSLIDPCEIGNNSIIQACYHAQIAKTSFGYSIAGEDLAPNGIADQIVLTNIPSETYPMPQGVFPVWGAIGGRTQAVFLGSDGGIYAIGEEDLLIDKSNTFRNGWSITGLRLPTEVTVCDVNKWEGAAGSGSEERENTTVVTGERDGFLVFSTLSGEAYITGDGAEAIQAQASNRDWTKIKMPTGVLVADFAVGYRTLLIQGSDGNLYASGPNTYLGNGTKKDLDELTLLSRQPPISVFGIAQIQAGFNSYMVLDGDGTIHVIGENTEGGLGIGNRTNLNIWSKVGEGCSDGVLQNVAYISTLSTSDFRINSSAILVDGTIRSWGSNSRQSITSGRTLYYSCPITPTGNNIDAVAISNGGHISPYVNTSAQICNIGHNKEGAFGDGNDENGDYGEYTCNHIPGSPEICGTKEANLSLEKTVNNRNPSTGEDVIFSITIKNRGPVASTGSFVRDQLSPAFFYLKDDSDGAYNNATGLWIVGPLEVGDSTTLNITVKVIAPGFQTNYAQILVDNEVDPNSTPGDNSDNQDDDDLVTLEVQPCPIDTTNILLCPGDSILIGGNWIYEPERFVEHIPLVDCDSIHITTVQFVTEPPFPYLQTDCEALEYHLSVDPNSIWDPTWDNGTITHETIYDGYIEEALLTLEADPNCMEQILIEFPPFPDMTQIPILEDTTILENTPLEINADLNGEEWKIRWSPKDITECGDCIIGNIVGTENTSITLHLEHFSGCTFESSFFLTVKKAPRNLFAPNVFSPNNDGTNDEWTVFTSENIVIEECKIYGRWGSLVYRSEGVPQWNGKINGTDCEQGVYVYYVKYRAGDDLNQLISGEVTLLR